ncbi:unnamed protein product, partial [Choristocarpus tenellus]
MPSPNPTEGGRSGIHSEGSLATLTLEHDSTGNRDRSGSIVLSSSKKDDEENMGEVPDAESETMPGGDDSGRCTTIDTVGTSGDKSVYLDSTDKREMDDEIGERSGISIHTESMGSMVMGKSFGSSLKDRPSVKKAKLGKTLTLVNKNKRSPTAVGRVIPVEKPREKDGHEGQPTLFTYIFASASTSREMETASTDKRMGLGDAVQDEDGDRSACGDGPAPCARPQSVHSGGPTM